MPISLADLSSFVLNGCAAQVNYALADPTTGAAPDAPAVAAFLNWPIFDALTQLGFSASSPASVGDGDLANVPDAGLPRLMAVAKLQTKRAIRGQLTDVSTTAGPDSQQLSDLARQLDREIDDLEKDVMRRFGVRPTAPAIAPMTSAPDPGAGGIVRRTAGVDFPALGGAPYAPGPPLPYGGFEFP